MSPATPALGCVLVVDDEEPNRALLQRLLSRDGYAVSAVADGESALASIAQRPPDVILLDVQLPGLNGFDVCRRIKQSERTRLTPVVMVTALNAVESRIDGITAGADDFLSKPFNAEELRARVGSLLRLKHYTDELESAEAVIVSLALTVEARDPYTDGHCRRLARYSVALGEALGLSAADLKALRLGGYLHDVGKIGIPDAVLLKPGKLTEAEWEQMRNHPQLGAQMLDSTTLRDVHQWVLAHHERPDGRGYPSGLRGDQIPLEARILAVADAFEAMMADRVYRSGMPVAQAIQELIRCSGSQFDPQVVDAMLQSLGVDAPHDLDASAPTVTSAA